MDANVRYFVMDWKERVKGSDLAQAIKEVEAFGRGSQVIDRAFDTGNDSFVTLVIPGDITYKGLKNKDLEEVVLGWCESVFLSETGFYYFKFAAQCGQPATDWLVEEEALKHIDRMEEYESEHE